MTSYMEIIHNTTFRPYRIHAAMKSRCSNPNDTCFCYYGGQGIIYSKRWSSFDNFWEDMEEEYCEHVKQYGEKNTTLERKNPSGNYCKENCCFATYKEQANNKKNNHFLIYKNKRKTISQWADSLKIKSGILQMRMIRGWSVDKVLGTSLYLGHIIKYKGKRKNITDWAKEYGIKRELLKDRLKQGWSIKKALETLPFKGKIIKYEGKEMSITGWSKELNISRDVLKRRLVRNWSIKRALETPVRKINNH